MGGADGDDESGVDEAVTTAALPLLTPGDVRALAARLALRPTKTLGQNFVVDPGTIRRIVRASGVAEGDVVLEVGPGLGSLTLGLLEVGARVLAVEIDPVLAAELPGTAETRAGGRADRLTVLRADALHLHDLPADPTALVANLPYNVAVPILLRLLDRFSTLASGLVMVQSEVADRLVAPPGSRTYGAPSVKIAWYASATRAGSVAASVFWPVPNVGSALVRLRRRPPPVTPASRAEVFALIDAAFAQRRKTLRAALASWAGSPQEAERVLQAAGVDPALRGERLGLPEFVAVAETRRRDTARERSAD